MIETIDERLIRIPAGCRDEDLTGAPREEVGAGRSRGVLPRTFQEEFRLANPSYPRLFVPGHTDVVLHSVGRVNRQGKAVGLEVVAFDPHIRIGPKNAVDLLKGQGIVIDVSDEERRVLMVFEPVLQHMEPEAAEPINASHKFSVAMLAQSQTPRWILHVGVISSNAIILVAGPWRARLVHF